MHIEALIGIGLIILFMGLVLYLPFFVFFRRRARREKLGIKSNRPVEVTALCLGLGFLAFAGFNIAYVVLNADEPILPASIAYFSLGYGVLAVSSSVGLWLMRKWGLYCLRGWILYLLIAFLATSVMFGAADLLFGVGALLFTIFIGGLLWLLHRYVTSLDLDVA